MNYFVSADGTNERNITALFDPSAATNSIGAGHVSDISMNANGTQFVFPYYPGLGSSGNFDSLIRLVTMNADGSARTTRYTALANQQIFSPIFAPDGQTIYFILTTSLVDNANVYTYTGIVYRLAPGATVPVAVTALSLKSGVNNADAVVFPELSINADGTKLAFINYVGSSDEIFVVGTDGTGLTRLTTNAALDASPSFTTDGLKIIFTSYRDGNAELYSINPDGTGETRLTYEIEPDTYPATRAKKAASAASRKAVSR